MKMRMLMLALTGLFLLADGAQAQWGRGYGGGYGGGWGGGYGGGYGAGVSFGSGSTRFGVGYSSPGYGYGGYGYGNPYGGYGYGSSIGAYGYGNNWGGSYYGNSYSPGYSNYYTPSTGYYTSGSVYPSSTSYYSPTTSYGPSNGAVISSSYNGGCGQAVYYPSTTSGTITTGTTGGTTTSFYPPDTTMGLQLSDIENDRAAKRAGLREGDIITNVGDTRVQSAEDLQKAFSKATGEVEITVMMGPSMKSEKVKVRPVDGKIGASVTAVAVPNR